MLNCPPISAYAASKKGNLMSPVGAATVSRRQTLQTSAYHSQCFSFFFPLEDSLVPFHDMPWIYQATGYFSFKYVRPNHA